LHFSSLHISFQGTINATKVMEMEPKCKLFEKTENMKSFMKTKLAKAGEGAGLTKVRQHKRRGRVQERAIGIMADIEREREEMRATSLRICDARCPRTNRHCRGVYLTQEGLENHLAKGKHDFPVGENARDFILREASNPGGLVEAGTRPDRQKKDSLFEKIIASENGSNGEESARCFGCFNRKENTIPYHKPPKLVEVLEALYSREPKLRASEMREEMRRMRDSDGGLLFCYVKRDTNGMLLSDDQIQAWINSRTQKKKKQSKGKQTDKDIEEARLVECLEKA
jgi:hypothetical protein